MFRKSLVIAVVGWLAACGGPQDGDAPPVIMADLLLRNGVIATVDPAIGTVEAVAVRGHEIIAAGSNAEIDSLAGPQTRIIELDGRFAMPGFIEGHAHFLGIGRARQILDLTTARSWDDIVRMVAVAADKSRPGDWIFGRGWHQDKWDGLPEGAVDGVPLNDSLSRVSANNPVSLVHASGHASMVNDVALAAAGIADDTPDPEGGTIVRAADGKATGLLRETAEGLVGRVISEYESRLTPEERDAVLREQAYLAARAALELGITSFQDAGSSFETIDFLKSLESEGALDVRLYVMVGGESNERMGELLPHYYMSAEDNDFLTVRAIKRVADGALGTHGAWLLEPYEDLPDTAGLAVEPLDDIAKTADLAVKHGYQLATHAIGDRANRETLNLYEYAWRRAGVDGRKSRWRIEHSQHVDPQDVPRFAELGVIAAMQGVHATSDGPWIPSRLGADRSAATSYVWRDLIGSGALVTNGTDAPVENLSAIASYYATVSRMTSNGERFNPEQAMTREEALSSYTINNAIAAFEEDMKGTLTPGKLADIVVLSQNILEVSEAELPRTQVEMTIVGGEVKYAAR